MKAPNKVPIASTSGITIAGLKPFFPTSAADTRVGSVIGALIIQTLTYGIYSLGVPPEINLVVKAAVVFVVMLLQSAEFRASIRQLVQRPARGEWVR